MNNPSAPDSFTAVDEEGNINHGEKNGEAQKHHLQFFNFHICQIHLHTNLCDLVFGNITYLGKGSEFLAPQVL